MVPLYFCTLEAVASDCHPNGYTWWQSWGGALRAGGICGTATGTRTLWQMPSQKNYSSWKPLVSAQRCKSVGAACICGEPNCSFWISPCRVAVPQSLSSPLCSGNPFMQRPKWLIEIQDWLLSTEHLHFNVASSFDLNHDISKGRFEFRRAHSWRRHFEGVWGREKQPQGAQKPYCGPDLWAVSFHITQHGTECIVGSQLRLGCQWSEENKCSRVTEKQLDRIQDMVQILGPQDRSLLLAFVSCIPLQRSLLL